MIARRKPKKRHRVAYRRVSPDRNVACLIGLTFIFRNLSSGQNAAPFPHSAALRILPNRGVSLIEIASSASASARGSEFNDFQRAPIDKDGTDMPLSVLSAPARIECRPSARGFRISTATRSNFDSEIGVVDCGTPGPANNVSRPRGDGCSLVRAFERFISKIGKYGNRVCQ